MIHYQKWPAPTPSPGFAAVRMAAERRRITQQIFLEAQQNLVRAAQAWEEAKAEHQRACRDWENLKPDTYQVIYTGGA